MSLTHSFSKLFKDLGLHPRSVSTAFGCRVNLAICLQVNVTAHLHVAFSKLRSVDDEVFDHMLTVSIL